MATWNLARGIIITVCDFSVMLDFICQVLKFRAGNGHPGIGR
jgi:hypothetical protein